MAKSNATTATTSADAFSMNAAYLNPALVSQMRTAFTDHPVISNIKLGQILDAKSYARLVNEVSSTKTRQYVEPLEYNYQTAQLKLPQLTTALAPLLKKTFNITVTSPDWKLVSLTWKEYSMILDLQKLRNGFDLIVDVTNDFPQNAGADIVYTTGGCETIELGASANTLFVVKITKQTRSFLRYANHYAKNKRRLFLVQHL